MSGWHELPQAILVAIYIVMSVVMLVGLYELVACYYTPLRPAGEAVPRRRAEGPTPSQN